MAGARGSDAGVRKPPGSWKVSDLDISVDPDSHPVTGASSGSDGPSRECTAGGAPSEPSGHKRSTGFSASTQV